jgi:hypothetical protein
VQPITHDLLVQRAVRWLRAPADGRHANGVYWRRGGCGVVVPEYHTWNGEIPDAIGFAHGAYSCVVECKTSRADFRRDRKKGRAMDGAPCLGHDRVYLAPEHVIPVDELPAGWGLVELQGARRRLVLVKPPVPNPDRCMVSELSLCYSLLRRAEVHGHLRDYLSPKWGGFTPPRDR